MGTLSGSIRAFFAGIYNPFAAKALTRLLYEVKPDVIQVQNLYPLISPSIFGPIKRHGIPVVMRCPNYRLFCPNGLHLSNGRVCKRCLGFGRELWCFLRNCERSLPKSLGYATRGMLARASGLLVHNITVFVVLSRFQKDWFVANGIPERQVEIIPNFAPVPECSIGPSGGLGDSVTFVGRISPEKGIMCLLEATRRLPDYPFVIAGNASRMPELTGRAPSNVVFRGHLSGQALHDCYERARILVVPSLCFEGFPNVVIRAMSLGKPVICSNIGGLPEIVEDGITGYLFEPGNARELTARIQALWDQPELCRKLGEAGREKVLRQYSADVCYQRIAEVYEKAVGLVEHNSH